MQDQTNPQDDQSLAEAAINKLMQLHPKGYDLSLDRITGLLEKLGNPQDKLPPIIHVAGTNGKGSFTAFSRALLEAENYLVHVHTSPHLVNWHERFRIGAKGGGLFVDDVTLCDAIERVAKANDNAPITVFEILSAVTFLLFSEHPADAVILEVGLGGRFDATNVITQTAASVIMPVSLDHQGFLGDTIEEIAFEKAGIIKRNTPVIIGQQPFEVAIEIICEQAKKNACPMTIYGQDFMGFEEHGRMVYQDENGLMDLPLPSLNGRHQFSNAASAIRAVKEAGFDISHKAIETAMKQVYWPGRMQLLPDGKLTSLLHELQLEAEIIIDGGHNVDAAKIVSQALSDMNAKNNRPLYLICGMLDTKEPEGFFKEFGSLPDQVLTVPIQSSDAGIPADDLAGFAKKSGLISHAQASVTDAIKTIIAAATQDHPDSLPPRILICGSLYLVGDVLALNGTPPQ